MSSASTCRQQSVAGSTIICRTTSQSSFSAKGIQKQKGENMSGTRWSSVFNYHLTDFPTPPTNIKFSDDITIYTSGTVVADLINGLNIYLSQVLHQQQNTDSVNGQIYSSTFHARYSRTPLTFTSEVGRLSTAARKEAKSVTSVARHPS